MVFLELRRDSRVTTGNSGCLLCYSGYGYGYSYGYTTVTLSGTKTPAPEGHDQGSCRLCLGHHPALLTIRLYPARPHPADSGQQQPEEGSWARRWAVNTQTGDPQQLPAPDPGGTCAGLRQAGPLLGAKVSATHSTCHGRAMGQDQAQRHTLLGPVLPGSPTSSQRPWPGAQWGSGSPGSLQS